MATEPSTTEARPSSWRSAVAPTEGMPGFVRAFYKSPPGKLLYYVTSDVRLFLRVSVLLAALFGVLNALFDALTFLGVPTAAVWATLFFDLLITVVAVGVLYALRLIVVGLFRGP